MIIPTNEKNKRPGKVRKVNLVYSYPQRQAELSRHFTAIVTFSCVFSARTGDPGNEDPVCWVNRGVFSAQNKNLGSTELKPAQPARRCGDCAELRHAVLPASSFPAGGSSAALFRGDKPEPTEGCGWVRGGRGAKPRLQRSALARGQGRAAATGPRRPGLTQGARAQSHLAPERQLTKAEAGRPPPRRARTRRGLRCGRPRPPWAPRPGAERDRGLAVRPSRPARCHLAGRGSGTRE
jgi:hypothetical protein